MMQTTAMQGRPSIFPAAQPFPLRTNALHLLGSLNPIKKTGEARKPILSMYARIEYLATNENGRTAMQAIEEANAKGLTLVPNKGIDERLNGEEKLWKAEAEFYPCWTGTFVAYGASGTPIGKTIEYIIGNITYVFPAPKKAQGRKNICLAINHGFTEEGKPLISYGKTSEKKFLVEIADESQIKIIENFPMEDGWHLTENEFGIPSGAPSSKENKNARKFFRHPVFVGLLARGLNFIDGFDVRHDVIPNHRLSERLGALAYKAHAEETQK